MVRTNRRPEALIALHSRRRGGLRWLVLALALAAPGPVLPGATGETHASPETAVEFSPRERRRLLRHSPLPEVPPDPTNEVADDPAAAHLGQFLFFDPRLSVNGEISCATCHDPRQSFADGNQRGVGLDEVRRHTPALWNVAHNRWFFWDGRADTLWAQATQPIENPLEHGSNRLAVAHLVHDDAELRAAYETIFGPVPDLSDAGRFPADARPVADDTDHPHHRAWSAMSAADRATVDRIFTNVAKCIAAYERRLVSRRAPFDVFVEGLRTGDAEALDALDADAQRGLKLFAGRANCELCHFGPGFTDGEFHSTGVPPLGGSELHDPGRYEGIALVQADPFAAGGPYSAAPDGPAAEKVAALVRSSESWGQFKTPSLRNVARTAPYMHEGQFETLEEVLRHYSTLERAVLPSHHQEQLLVPLHLTDEEIADLESFLRSLTDEGVDPALLTAPASPVLRSGRPAP